MHRGVLRSVVLLVIPQVCFDPPPGALVPDGGLTYVLHLERSKGSGAYAVDTIPIRVPRLLPPS